ncbi:hypothetical protein HMPREF1869_00117 [Bacteroidales bacterium KA00251]|nr:hypothetical protein HMPREF1869_00117 [Bacteroidales bacterium KA00251]
MVIPLFPEGKALYTLARSCLIMVVKDHKKYCPTSSFLRRGSGATH